MWRKKIKKNIDPYSYRSKKHKKMIHVKKHRRTYYPKFLKLGGYDLEWFKGRDLGEPGQRPQWLLQLLSDHKTMADEKSKGIDFTADEDDDYEVKLGEDKEEKE